MLEDALDKAADEGGELDLFQEEDEEGDQNGRAEDGAEADE